MFINLHTHKYTNNSKIVEIVNQYPWDFDWSLSNYSIGIHPWYIDEKRLYSDLDFIDKTLTQKECLALGECGLDKRIEIPFGLQLEVFQKQLQLAEKHKKPVILHLVGAFQELISIKNSMNISVPMIIHGFSKNEQLAKQLLDHGFYLSFGKYLLKKPELESVFKSIPQNRFFLETDTLEESIENVYQIAATYKGITLEEIQKQIIKNYNQVFKL